MIEELQAQNLRLKLANKDWVMREFMDTERRIEKAFHEQKQYLAQHQAIPNEKLDNTLRWMIGLIVAMTIAIILAVLFK